MATNDTCEMFDADRLRDAAIEVRARLTLDGHGPDDAVDEARAGLRAARQMAVPAAEQFAAERLRDALAELVNLDADLQRDGLPPLLPTTTTDRVLDAIG